MWSPQICFSGDQPSSATCLDRGFNLTPVGRLEIQYLPLIDLRQRNLLQHHRGAGRINPTANLSSPTPRSPDKSKKSAADKQTRDVPSPAKSPGLIFTDLMPHHEFSGPINEPHTGLLRVRAVALGVEVACSTDILASLSQRTIREAGTLSPCPSRRWTVTAYCATTLPTRALRCPNPANTDRQSPELANISSEYRCRRIRAGLHHIRA